jgi:hypothetical protein
MYAIRGRYDGKTIIPLEHIRGRPNVEVIITFLDDLGSVINTEDETESLLALSGTWEDARPVEAIVSDIYESRTVSRENITL